MISKKKRSAASKRYWASIPKEERSRRMSELKRKHYAKMTKKDRKAIGVRLAKGRMKAHNSKYD